MTYTLVGDGTRALFSWAPNQSLFIRARGYYGTGWHDGSGSIVESIRNVYQREPVRHLFEDDVLTAGSSTVRAVHITELRTRIDTLRLGVGLTAYPYTNPTLTGGTTIIQAQHIIDLRTALAEAYVASGLTPPTSLIPASDPGTMIKATHIEELRSAVQAIE